MGRHMSLDDMLEYVSVRVKDIVGTRQRFPCGRREFDRFFREVAVSYKHPAVIPPGATFDRIRRKMKRRCTH
jgi:hypothetical protein